MMRQNGVSNQGDTLYQVGGVSCQPGGVSHSSDDDNASDELVQNHVNLLHKVRIYKRTDYTCENNTICVSCVPHGITESSQCHHLYLYGMSTHHTLSNTMLSPSSSRWSDNFRTPLLPGSLT